MMKRLPIVFVLTCWAAVTLGCSSKEDPKLPTNRAAKVIVLLDNQGRCETFDTGENGEPDTALCMAFGKIWWVAVARSKPPILTEITGEAAKSITDARAKAAAAAAAGSAAPGAPGGSAAPAAPMPAAFVAPPAEATGSGSGHP